MDFNNLHEMDFSVGSKPSGAFGGMGVLLHQYAFNGATAAWEKVQEQLFYMNCVGELLRVLIICIN